MEVRAHAKFVKISPKKAISVVRALRGAKTDAALSQLRFDARKTSRILYKLIASAVQNASNNYNLKPDNLKIKALTVDSGPSQRRYWFRSHGRADRLLKRSSHFSVVLEEVRPTLVKKTVEAPAATKEVAKEVTAKTKPAAKPKTEAKPEVVAEAKPEAAAESKTEQ